MLHKAARTNCLADSCNHYNYNGEASCTLRMLIPVHNYRDLSFLVITAYEGDQPLLNYH
jgi:hypothetical protein